MSAIVVMPAEGKRVDLGGLGIVFKLWGEPTGGDVGIVEHPLLPGTLAAPMHWHDNEHEISYVLEGEVTLQIGEEVIKAPPGALVLKPKGIPHTFWNAGNVPARILEIIAPGGFEKYFDDLGELFRASGGTPDRAEIIKLAERYGLHFDMSSAEGIMHRYGVSFEGR